MIASTDLFRLREIDDEQARLIQKLVELKREETAIQAKHPSMHSTQPVPHAMLEERVAHKKKSAVNSGKAMTRRWRETKEAQPKERKPRERRYDGDDPRLRYFQLGRG